MAQPVELRIVRGEPPYARGQRCRCTGHGCIHAGRCSRRHGLGDLLTWSSSYGRPLCGCCRSILERGNKAAIARDLAAARRELATGHGQQDMFGKHGQQDMFGQL